MTAVTFESATIADCIRRANVIAPTKGKELDQLAGFFCEVRPDGNGGGTFVLRCTNQSVYYTEQVDVVKIDGIDQDWRLPSIPLNGIISNLPISTGRTVTFQREVVADPNSASGYVYTNRLIVLSGRTRASMMLIPTDSYPNWYGYDFNTLNLIEGFGQRVAQVSWAVAKSGGEPMTGIYIDGDNMLASDRHKLAMAPAKIDLGSAQQPITVPLALLTSILQQIMDVYVGVEGNFLLISPNEYVQIKVGIYGIDYPKLHRIYTMETDHMILLEKNLTISSVMRVLSIGATDRQLDLRITIGKEEISFFVEGESKTETAEDTLFLGGQANHELLTISVDPQNFLEAMNRAPSPQIALHYSDDVHKFIRLETDNEYKCYLAPRRIVPAK